ncbi:MAG: efflux RND transporter periplasmic adaptor subunit, partial [Planctomycetota bacterium]
DHAGHAGEDVHAGEDDHGNEVIVRLSAAEMKAVGLVTARAGGGTLRLRLRLPGEIRMNTDRMAHVAPRASGVVREVAATLGAKVRRGQPLAVLESSELAEAKAAYLAESERLDLAHERFSREERLWRKKITSEQDYLEAKQALAEARIAKRTAEQKLHVLGVSEKGLARLADEPDESFLRYEMTAPADGTIVEKHIAVGEQMGADSTPFTLADLDTVWAILTIHQKDVALFGVGIEVEISTEHGGPKAVGKVEYVSPVVDEATRTAHARVVVDNSGGRWRPGIFVSGAARVSERRVAVLVPAGAIQTVDGESIVFVKHPEGFVAERVRTGQSDGAMVEVIAGLKPGDEYVTEGSFELKAKIVTSGMDAHAGHGH